MIGVEHTQSLVSVILPNRNHAQFLPDALYALLAQTWIAFELIVLDDASTDDSREVIARFQAKDPRVTFISLSEHCGIHRTVRIGVERASGEFLYIAAADDIVEPDFLKRCVQEMERLPQAGLSFSDPSEFYRTGNRKILFPLYLDEAPIYLDPKRFVALQTRSYFHISPNTGIYRLAAFRRAGGYRQELDLLSDWFVTMVVAVREGAVYLPEPLTCVAVREDSYSATALQDPDRRRTALSHALAILATPAYADVRKKLRQAAILPEYQFVTLWWLMRDANGWDLITPRSIFRILIRGGWSYMRRYVPLNWRRYFRKLISRRSRAGE